MHVYIRRLYLFYALCTLCTFCVPTATRIIAMYNFYIIWSRISICFTFHIYGNFDMLATNLQRNIKISEHFAYSVQCIAYACIILIEITYPAIQRDFVILPNTTKTRHHTVESECNHIFFRIFPAVLHRQIHL